MIARLHRLLAGEQPTPAIRFAIFPALFCPVFFAFSILVRAQSQPAASTPWAATIILPPKVVAGHPATLAALDAEGKLLPGVAVEIGTKDKEAQHVTTGATGRAVFTALGDAGSVIAKSSTAAAAALADTGASPAAGALVVPPVVSHRDRFSICGGDFRGDAEANRVQINADPALVLAASPECLVVLAGPNVKPGPAKVTVQSGAAQWSAATTLVLLEFDSPTPALVPLKRSSLTVRVRGSEEPLSIVVENKSPGVLKFLRGDAQQLKTSGSASNTASVEVQTLRSGAFSFQARLVPTPDLETARRYLSAAAPLADKDSRRKIAGLAKRLGQHPGDAGKVKRELDRIIAATPHCELRTILEAARLAM
jgi:hypothetical protein